MEGFTDISTGEARRGYVDVVNELNTRFPNVDKIVTESDKKEFIIGTENGVLYELQQKNPDKKFYTLPGGQTCTSMKKITLEKVRDCLKYNKGEVSVDDSLRRKANVPLNRMLETAK